MLTLLAAALPMCYITVATDVPNPIAVRAHEMAHCWGWRHPERHDNGKVRTNYRSYSIPLWYRLKGDYPINRVEIDFEVSKDVAKICGSAYGCSCGGVSPKGK